MSKDSGAYLRESAREVYVYPSGSAILAKIFIFIFPENVYKFMHSISIIFEKTTKQKKFQVFSSILCCETKTNGGNV